MSAQPYVGITFSYDEFLKDIDRMRKLAAKLLEPQCISTLQTFRTEVEGARTASGGCRLAIAPGRCLRTIPSTEYRGSGQVRSVYGELSFEWGIINPDGGRRRQESFNLVGVATTGIWIRETAECPVAHWQFEVGDGNSPGCHFHSSVNQRGDDGMFPQWLKLPRLPGLLVSPFDGLDFLLGELFPISWSARVSESSDERDGWATSQSNRMLKILKWQQDMVRKLGYGTPWISLKKEKPPANVLLER